ncbi:ATP-binding protein [Spirillospora albida]|uniref:ATP-binding protein n=1 Tax=Spirillospora albida TaxID=58123 RepID=UPI000A05DD10|nr:ATP-binding protein [Spirillospora albida]
MGAEGAGLTAGRRRVAVERGRGGARVDGTVIVGRLTLPGTRRSVGYARSFVRETVPDLPALDDLVMVASETVANAITHTASGREGGRVTVVLAAEPGIVRLEVVDDGAAPGRPRVRDESGGETGRGIRIVEAVADRWGFRTEGTRTVVWAEFPAPRGAGPGTR